MLLVGFVIRRAIRTYPAPTQSNQQSYLSVLHYTTILHKHIHLQSGLFRCGGRKLVAGKPYHVILARTSHIIPRDLTTKIILGEKHISRNFFFI